jgi:hypothetical protein
MKRFKSGIGPWILSLKLITMMMILSGYFVYSKSKAVPLHTMEALGGRGGIAPTHSRPRH